MCENEPTLPHSAVTGRGPPLNDLGNSNSPSWRAKAIEAGGWSAADQSITMLLVANDCKGSVWAVDLRSTGRPLRRISLVAGRPGEGPLTAPIAAAHPRRQEPLFMPHTCRSRYPPGSAQMGGNRKFDKCGPTAQIRYSITSSASCSSDCGTVRPSALAVLRLMTRSNLVGS